MAFEFETTRTHFAGLGAETRMQRVGRKDIVFGQVEEGRGDKAVVAARLVLYADFVLLRCGRLRGAATIQHTRLRIE